MADLNLPDLRTTYLGLTLKNPIVPSSTPLSRTLDPVLHLEDAGAAAIVMHSLFEEDVVNDERMMDRFLVNPETFGESAGHLPADAGYQSKLDTYLAQIEHLKARLSIPVIASLNGSSLSGWVELGREMEAAGADALELNAWYMASAPALAGTALEERYLALLRELKTVVSIPVTMKLSPFFSSLPNFVAQVEAAGGAGVSLFNRFFQPDIDLDTLSVVDRVQLSTPADGLLTMRWIALLRGHTGLSLAATGGVHGADDALKMLQAGADVVHMASALLQNGPQRIATVASLGDNPATETTRVRLAAGELWVRGVPVDTTWFDRRVVRHRVRLPTYPFERQRYWIEAAPAGNVVALPVVSSIPVKQPQEAETSSAPFVASSTVGGDRRSRLLVQLRDLFEDTAGFDLAHADTDANFIELGLDSLMLTQVALQLQKTFPVRITFRQLMGEYASPDRLTQGLDAQLPAEAAPAPVAAPAAPTSTAKPSSRGRPISRIARA